MSKLSGEYAPSPTGWVREQVETFEASGGREGNILAGTGDPIIMITNRGARTGKIRKTPLMRVERDGKYLAVASKGGAPADPQWVNNFRAHPQMELQDGQVKKEYVARELSGSERTEWWQYAVETWKTYASYQDKTDRLIPLFLLEPVD